MMSRAPDPRRQRLDAIHRYAPGQHVEYNSLSNGRWIEAIVDYVHSDGTVDLDVRKRADARYIRELSPRVQRPQPAAAQNFRAARPAACFRIGERVQYHSEKKRCWINATVRNINRDGTIDIDRDDGVYHAAHPTFVRSALLDECEQRARELVRRAVARPANVRPARAVHARPSPRARVVRRVRFVDR